MSTIRKNEEVYSEPTLEEFGLDASIYSDFKAERQELEKIKNENNEKIKATENNSFFDILSGIVFYSGVFLCIWIFTSFSRLFAGWFFVLLALLLWIWIWHWLYEKNHFFCNLFSFGKYNKAKETKEEIEKKIQKLTESIKNTVNPFEEAFTAYYQKQIDDFYATKLYKKRSGTIEFEESLIEFQSIIETLSSANNILLTKSFTFSLWGYSEYLEKRRKNQDIQIEKQKSKEFSSVENFVKKASQSQIRKISINPEEKYRIPKKIDWDKILKNRKITGMHGEEMAIAIEQDYLKSIGRDDLADKIRHVSKEDGDGLGYDILSFFPDGKEKYIEIKSTTKSLETPFYISRNELSFLQEHQQDSFIYRLLLNVENTDDVLLQVNSSSDFFETKELIPVQYIVQKKQIK